MATTTIIGVTLAFFLIIGTLLSRRLGIDVDPREPPNIPPKIPFIGHIIGLMREGQKYFIHISRKCKHPIFTIQMGTGRTYIVSSPAVAVHIQRSSAALSFDQMVIEAMPRLCGINKETHKILEDATANKENRTRLVTHVTHNVLHPQLGRSKMPDIGLSQLSFLDESIRALPAIYETDLFEFFKRRVTEATMATFYGPENPFAIHPELIDHLWNWERDVVAYSIGIFPSITAREAYLGIEACTKGFIEYFDRGRHLTGASRLILERSKTHFDAGISIPEHARLEVAMALAFTINAPIMTFWLVNNIFSRPDLLSSIRQEIQENALVNSNIVSYTAIRDSCPLLNSCFRESMRICAPLATSRFVLKDIMIMDTYLLRKGSVAQIAGNILHADKEIWGADVDTFNPHRFLYAQSGTKASPDGNISSAKADQCHAAAFRGFGGGSSLCPGRHFATMEVLSVTAVLVLGFDLEAKGLGWNPPRDDKKFPFSAIKPARKVEVKMKRKAGTEGVDWIMQY